MPADVEPEPAEPDHGKIPPEHRPTANQVALLNKTIAKLREAAPEVDWAGVAREAAGAPWPYVTKTTAQRALETLQAQLAELAYPDADTEGRRHDPE
jgi:hypothetical protein